MAYRKISEAQVPSFLDEFLDQIQSLPAQVKAKYAEMRELDDRTSSLMSDAERAAAEAVKRASVKSSGGSDPLKRTFQELLSCQAKASDCSQKKVELAESAYELIDDTVKSLDDKLKEYETQLKKEGRWPGNTDKNDSSTGRKIAAARGSSTPRAGADDKAAAQGNAVAATVTGESEKVGSRVSTKARKRERERDKGSSASQNKDRHKSSDTNSAVPAKGSRDSNEVVASDNLVVVDDMNVDPDEPRYCFCNDISYGDMVACEGKNCLHEWFHYQCVGLTSTPKGAWFCPDCKAKRKKK